MKKITTVVGILTLLAVSSAFAAEGSSQPVSNGSSVPAASTAKDTGMVLKKSKKNRKHKKNSKSKATPESSAASPSTSTPPSATTTTPTTPSGQ